MVRKVPEQLSSLLSSLDGDTGPVCSLVTALWPAFTAQQQDMAKTTKQLFRAAIVGLLEFFEDSYLPEARPVSGCGGVLAGSSEEVYGQCLRYHTTTSLSAQEIHAIGLEEVERIGRRYQVLIRGV